MNNLQELRKIELELLEQFIKVCEREKLKWYVSHGTLLGAVRDGGFLIWDDDIDVAMPAGDYSKLLLHKEWFDSPYYLQTPFDRSRSGLHLFKNGTTAFGKPLYDVLRHGGHCGICIDILPLDEIGDTGYYNFANTTIRKDYFEPYSTMKFEYLTVNAPAKARQVLSMLYGYWNWPNGVETQRPPHYWFYDTETDYTVYVKRYTGWLNASKDKNIFLFGAADSLRIWLKDFSLREQVVCTFDNDSNKWGTEAFGVNVCNPVDIHKLLGDDGILIIASIWHQEIGRQLEQMGIKDYYVFLDDLFVNEFKGEKNI